MASRPALPHLRPLSAWPLASLALGVSATAQGLGPEQPIADYLGSVEVEMADLDSDGDTDIVAGLTLGGMGWYENVDSQGTCGTPRWIGDISTVSLLPADLDGDGDPDLLGFSAANGMEWHANQGLGSFDVGGTFPATASGGAIATDLDLDGDLDVVAVGSGTYVWYANADGLGSFGPEQVITSGVFVHFDLLAADFDGDGDNDIAGSSQGTGASTYENTDGLGGFSGPQLLPVTSMARDMDHADLDGDGDQDLLLAGFWNPPFDPPPFPAYRLDNDGTGSFGPPQTIGSSTNLVGVRAADTDGDGDQDYLMCFFTAGMARAENLDGLGSFGAATSVTSEPCSRFAFGDLDGDGDEDLATAYTALQRYENTDGSGNFALREVPASAHKNVQHIEPADFDGDAVPDVLAVSGLGPSGQLAWYRNSGQPGDFDRTEVLDPISFGGVGISATDIDGDGDLDIAASTQIPTWFENADGAGAFASGGVISSQGSRNLTTADLDGDGDPDVLTVANADLLFWNENTDGLGTFGPDLTITTLTDFPETARAADLDADGDLDVLSASANDDEIAWYPNVDGSGTFGPQILLPATVDNPKDVLAADLDGDGDLDVVCNGWSSAEIAWFSNTDGLGSFGTQQPVATGVSLAREIHAEDLDSDGDQDVLYTMDSQFQLFWVRNDGSGVFGSSLIIDDFLSGAYDVTTADMDGDSDPDVLATGSKSAEILWYENLTCSTQVLAAEVVRAGTPPNPIAFMPGVTSGPVVGATWDPVVDHAIFLPGALVDVVGITPGPANLPLPGLGTLLCDLSVPPLLYSTAAGTPFAIPVPLSCGFVGASVCAQAGSVAEGAVQLTNALDLTVGTL